MRIIRACLGVLPAGPSKGLPDLGLRHAWILRLQLGVRTAQEIGLVEAPDR